MAAMPAIAAGNLSVSATASCIAVNGAIGHRKSAVGEYTATPPAAAGVWLAIAASTSNVSGNAAIRHRQGPCTGDSSAKAPAAIDCDSVSRVVSDDRDIHERQVT
jgi:hypothetical protein